MKKNQSSLGVILTGGLKEEVTPWAGVALLAELYRKAGIEAAAERALPKKRSPKGLTQGQMLESFVLLSALGGDCIDDMEHLRSDSGMEAMLGYRLPACETARQWLDKFHDEELMNQQPLQRSFIASESGALAGLKEPNRQVIHTYVERVKPGWQVTLDVDAHLVETAKANAHYCYQGYRSFQPMDVEWAETALVPAGEFREGNVYAGQAIMEIVDQAYNMLPPGLWQVKVRSDSAPYQQDLLHRWHERRWHFAVSADMSQGLRKEIETLAVDSWKLWKVETRGMLRECAEPPYVPTPQYERKDSQPYRYLAARIRRQEGELFEDGEKLRHFALVTNIWDMDGQELLHWQRAKAGTIEHIHHILDNELAGGVYPSTKHGANAAWLRIQVPTHILLQLLNAVALSQQYATARPKRLTFAAFTRFGRVINHAGIALLRIASTAWEGLIRTAHYRIAALGLAG